MAIEISKERTKVFPYKLGDQTLHAHIAMMQGRHIKYAQEHFPLRDDDLKIQKGDNGLPLIDWNAAGDNFYQELFRGFDEEITIGGVVVNSRSPEGKKQIEANLPAGFAAWVLANSRKGVEFYQAEKETREGLPPTPDGSTD